MCPLRRNVDISDQNRAAFYVATHEAVMTHGRLQLHSASEAKGEHIKFRLLPDGRTHFEGSGTVVHPNSACSSALAATRSETCGGC